MQVTTAENGKEGVEIFSRSQPGYYDAILMDIRMPVMDGNTAAHTIRLMEREDAADIPILAVSADAYQENVDESIDAGMNGHISKPVDPLQLYRVLEDEIRGEKQ